MKVTSKTAPKRAGTKNARNIEEQWVMARLERIHGEDPARYAELMRFLDELLEEQRAETEK